MTLTVACFFYINRHVTWHLFTVSRCHVTIFRCNGHQCCGIYLLVEQHQQCYPTHDVYLVTIAVLTEKYCIIFLFLCLSVKFDDDAKQHTKTQSIYFLHVLDFFPPVCATEWCDSREQTKSGYPGNLGGRKYPGQTASLLPLHRESHWWFTSLHDEGWWPQFE